jgi:hypothetical protein
MSNIRDLIEARLLTYDPTLDVTEGSPARVLVIEPLAIALGAEALETDVREFTTSKLREAFPDLTLSPGDALTDVLINASSLLIEPYRAEISRVERAQSLIDPESLSPEDMDALASNWLVDRRFGARARVTVTVTFERPVRFALTQEVSFTTNTGQIFRPETTFTFTADDVRDLQGTDGLYRVPVPCIASDYGVDYNVASGAISFGLNIPPHVSVTNSAPARGGLNQETNVDFARRLTGIANERSLVSERGIRAKVLGGVFGASVTDVAVAGFGDEEMSRDTVPVDAPGDVIGHGFAVPMGRLAVILMFHGVPQQAQRMTLTPLAGGQSVTVTIESATAALEVGRLPGTTSYIVEVDVSSLVGAQSVVLTSAPQLFLDQELITGEIHLGGKSDVYVTPMTDETLKQESTPSIANGYSGQGLAFAGNRVTLDEDVPARGTHLIVETTNEQHAYRILKRDGANLWVDVSIGTYAAPDARYRLINKIEARTTHDVDVMLPRPGQGDYIVDLTAGSAEVVAPGVSGWILPDDTLRIPSVNAEYTITHVGEDVLTLATLSRSTGSFVATIIRNRSTTMARPIAHIDSVMLGDTRLPHGPSLNAEVLTATEPTLKSAGQKGRVLPHYTALNALTTFALANDVNDYNVDLVDNRGNGIGYSDGARAPWQGDVLVAYQADGLPSGEVALPGDLFVPGPYTVVSVWGDQDMDGVLDALDAGAVGDMLEARVPQPAPASPGDLVVIKGESLIVDRVYPLAFRTNENEPTSYEKAIRVTLLRLRSHAAPPRASSFEQNIALTHPIEGDGAIHLYDLLSMLCLPERLMSSLSVSAQLVSSLEEAGYTPTSEGELIAPSSSVDIGDCEVWTPATGKMKLYYHDARDVHLTRLWWPLYSTEEEAMYHDLGVNQRIQPLPTLAEDLLIDSPPSAVIGADDPRMWRRDATFLVDQPITMEVLTAPSTMVMDQHGERSYDAIGWTLEQPMATLLDIYAGDEIHVLEESLTFEGTPPSVVPLFLMIEEGEDGSTPVELIDSYAELLTDSRGLTYPDIAGEAVNAYGQTVVDYLGSLPRTLSLVPSDMDVSELPRRQVFYYIQPRNNTYGLPAYHVIPGTGTLEAARLYEKQTFAFPQGMSRDYVWVDTSANARESADVVLSSTSNTLTIDRVFSNGTSPVLARGWCAISLENLDELIIEGGRVIDAEGVLSTPLIGDNVCGVGVGGTTRFLTSADVGRHITLLNATYVPGENAPEGAHLVREHLGTFKILSVTDVAIMDPEANRLRTVHQTIKLDAEIDSPAVSMLVAEGEEYYLSFFHLSDAVEANDLKTVVQAMTYHREPTPYRVAKLDVETLSGEQYAYVTTLDDLQPSVMGYGVFFQRQDGAALYNNARIFRNPFSVVRPSMTKVTTTQDIGGLYSATVRYRASTSREVNVGEILKVTRAGEEAGYELVTSQEAYSSAEEPLLELPPVIYRGDQRLDLSSSTLSIEYTTSPVIDQLAETYAGEEHRVVCSDVLFRRALPCYLGVSMTYTGGSEASVVRDDVRRFLEYALNNGIDFSPTELYALASRRGAVRVLPGAKVYLVATDVDRRHHVFFLDGPLSTALPSSFHGTLRVAGLQVATTSKLGTILDVTRS